MASAKQDLLISILSSGEATAFDLLRASRGRLCKGTIYVTLARMEKKGIVRSRRERPPGWAGHPRRLYRLVAGKR